MCRSTPTSRPDETSPSPSPKHALRPNEDTNAAFSFLPDASETREMSRISRKVRVFCCAPNVSSQSAGECRRQRFPNILSLPSPSLPPPFEDSRAHQTLCSRHHLYGRVRPYRQLSRDRRQRWSSGIVRTERDRQSSPTTCSPTGDKLDACVPGC